MGIRDLLSLDGKHALITGGSRGLGRAIAIAYADAGASVVICARRGDLLDETAGVIRDRGGHVDTVVADVTSEHDVQVLRAAAGAVDILVNNAAMFPSHPWETVPLGSWQEVFALNLFAPFRLCQVFAPGMIERGWGRIVNIASVYGRMGPKWQLYPDTWGPSSYFASKHGVHGITHYLAPRLARHGVTINSLSPGGVITGDQRIGLDAMGEERIRKADQFALTEVQMGRTGDADDYVGPAVFLASPAARYVTGQDLVVDGGWSSW